MVYTTYYSWSIIFNKTDTNWIHLNYFNIFFTNIFYFKFSIEKILYGLLGSTLIILLFLLFMYIGEIPFKSFFHQYILFPLSFGESRLEDGFLFPLEFQRDFYAFQINSYFRININFRIF